MIAIKGKGAVAEGLSSNQLVSLHAPLPDPGPVNLDFYTLVPCRVLDTRDGAVPIASGSTLVFPVAGNCGIPSTARAVSLNITVVAPSGVGYVTLFQGGEGPPPTAAINFTAGLTRSNNAALALSSDGTGTLSARVMMAGGGAVHVVVDVNGYFQ